jgi:hypothetical protein
VRFVVWIWKGSRHYEPEHVNHLYRQLSRQCPGRFSLVAITDDSGGFLPGVEVIKTPPAALALAGLQSPEKQNFPSCYRRLWMFSEEAKMLGDRVMLIDVDLVFTADPAPLFDRREDFVGWRPMRTWGKENRFGGGIYLLRTGTRTHVWDSFKGHESIARARAAGLRGSDQAWLSYCLASTEVSWPQNSGIYSVRDLTHGTKPSTARRQSRPAIRRNSQPLKLPTDAIIVQFNGPQNEKPWCPIAKQKHAWLEHHCA